MEYLAFHPRQRPGVVSKAGDKGLELDGKRTKEYWQPVKQELGSHPYGGHILYGITLKPAHKECVHNQNHLDFSFIKYCVGDSDKLSLI